MIDDVTPYNPPEKGLHITVYNKLLGSYNFFNKPFYRGRMNAYSYNYNRCLKLQLQLQWAVTQLLHRKHQQINIMSDRSRRISLVTRHHDNITIVSTAVILLLASSYYDMISYSYY